MNRQTLSEECCATAALYSLGSLPAEEARQFEQRLASACPLCTAAAAEHAQTAELLMNALAPREPRPEVRRRLLEKVAADSPAPSPKRPEMTVVRRDESPWLPSKIPGVETRPLLGDKTLLVRMQPGALFPEHAHPLAEQCYVLEGSITDSDGITAWKGDFVCMAAGTSHAPIHTQTGCVLLIAYA